jgi:flavodoxin
MAGQVMESDIGGRLKIVVLYASRNGSTRRVVKRLAQLLCFSFDCFDVKAAPTASALARYDVFLFFSPTYGNEELPQDMEQFIVNFRLDLSQKRYAICELGNYYGYDRDFGAMKIIRHHLERLHGLELIRPLSMDSLPRKDWKALSTWCAQLTASLRDVHA